MSDLFMQNLGSLRIEPTAKRIRASLDGHTVVDSRAALLVWEPKRVVPTYAAPERDIAAIVQRVEPGVVDAHFERIPVWILESRSLSARLTVARPDRSKRRAIFR